MIYLEDFYLSPEDFKDIENFLKKEHIQLNECDMYNAGNYCILSAVQNSSTHQRIYKDMIFANFSTYREDALDKFYK